MNPRTTGILFLVALALGAFVWFYQVRGEERRREAEEEARRLFPGLSQEDVRAIAFTTTDGREVRLEFRDEGWTLVEPLEFPADESALSGMASALAQLSSEGKVEEPQEPGVYGLGEDARSVRFETEEGEHEVRFGGKTPVGHDTYASVGGEDAVYTVPSYRATTFERALDDVRERRVLRFDRTALDRVAVDWTGGGVELERRDTGWRLVAPLEAPADAKTVEDLLADLSFLRAEGFLDEVSPSVEESFDDPFYRVVLSDLPEAEAEGEEAPAPITHRMAVGAAVEGAQRAVRGDGAAVFTVASERLEDLPRKVDAFRFRTLASFPAADATRMELVFHPSGGEPATVTAERGDEGWSAEPEAVPAGTLARFASELSRLRAEEVVAESMGAEELAEAGLRPPRVRIRVWGEPREEGGEPARLAEVALGDYDAERGILARAADRETVYRLDYELAEHLPVSLEAFRNRFASPEPSGQDAPAQAGAEAGPGTPGDALPAPAATP